MNILQQIRAIFVSNGIKYNDIEVKNDVIEINCDTESFGFKINNDELFYIFGDKRKKIFRLLNNIKFVHGD